MEIEENILFNIVALLIGITYGALAQLKQFCFSGGIKDLILFKHTRRTASLIVAIAIAIFSTQAVSFIFDINLTNTRYFSNVNYIFIIMGGLLFGYGMMVSDGCSSRHIIKTAQGDKHSALILLVLGIFAYLTYLLFRYYGENIYTSKIVASTTISDIYIISPFIIAPLLLGLLFITLRKCMNFLQVLDGAAIGLLISFVWYITYYLKGNYFTEIKLQSLSFVYPLGKITQFTYSGFNTDYLIFSVFIVFGVFIGAFISSLFNKQYSKKFMCDSSQQNPPSLIQKLIGGAAMGVGGVFAMGCTVGQGLSGLSTLSSISLLAIISIYTSAYFTAKYLHKNNALIACFVFDFKCRGKD